MVLLKQLACLQIAVQSPSRTCTDQLCAQHDGAGMGSYQFGNAFTGILYLLMQLRGLSTRIWRILQSVQSLHLASQPCGQTQPPALHARLNAFVWACSSRKAEAPVARRI